MFEELLSFNPQDEDPFIITLAGITHRDENYHIRRPNSDTTVIEYILSGEGYIDINGCLMPVTADEIYILPKGISQHYYSSSHNPWEKVFINMSGNLAVQLIEKFGLNKKFIYDGTGIIDSFLKIAEIVRHPPQMNDARSFLSGIYIEILSRLSQSSEQITHSDEAVTLKNIIDKNSNRFIGNNELAKTIYRSPDYCVKLFKKEYGVTPYEYQLRVKTDMACTLLSGTGMNVYEIAHFLGYSDHCYFSGQFKKRIGCSPREYRKSTHNNR